MMDANNWVIIVAGGSGTRMGSDLPKQFIEIDGQPILVHTINRFADAGIHNQVLVLPVAYHQLWYELQNKANLRVNPVVVPGGSTRTASVRAGLSVIPIEADSVGIHDAVRPMVSSTVITEAYKSAKEYGSGVPVVNVKDSLRHKNGSISQAVDRSQIVIVQTPQVFNAGLLKRAYDELVLQDVSDDATVFELAGHQVVLTQGAYDNIKITTPEDLIIAEALLRSTTT